MVLARSDASVSASRLTVFLQNCRPLSDSTENSTMPDTGFSASRLTVYPKDSSRPDTHTERGVNFPKNLVSEILCMVATSRVNLNHWDDTKGEKWKEHIKVMTKRFENSNITAGLIVTATAVLLSSTPPLSNLMNYSTPAPYALSLISFAMASLSAIFGSTVYTIYEAGTSYKDMNMLKDLSQWQKVYLLLWLAGPSIFLKIAIVCLFLSIMISTLYTENAVFIIITAVAFLFLIVNGCLSIYIFTFVGPGKKPASDLELGPMLPQASYRG